MPTLKPRLFLVLILCASFFVPLAQAADRRTELQQSLESRYRLTVLGPRKWVMRGDENMIRKAGGILVLRRDGLAGTFDRAQIAQQAIRGDKVELLAGTADQHLPLNEKFYVNSVYVGSDLITLGLVTVRNMTGKNQTGPVWMALSFFFDKQLLEQGDIDKIAPAIERWIVPEGGGAYVETLAAALPTAPPADLNTGMTREELLAAAGNPLREISFGSRTWMTYPDMVVILENGKLSSVDRSSKPPAKVAITSDPLGADVMVEGDFVSSTPATLQLPAGKYKITIHMDGYQDWHRDVQVISGAEINLNAHLAK